MKYAAAFAVLAIVAMGVAGIATGVGFTASTTTTENDITADFIILDLGDSQVRTFEFGKIDYFTIINVETNEDTQQVERKVEYRIPAQTV